jgi:hypothetical protein
MNINYLIFVPNIWSSSHNQYSQKAQYSALLNLFMGQYNTMVQYADIRHFTM